MAKICWQKKHIHCTTMGTTLLSGLLFISVKGEHFQYYLILTYHWYLSPFSHIPGLVFFLVCMLLHVHPHAWVSPYSCTCDVRGQPEVPSTLLNLRQGLSLPWNSLGRWADCQIPEAPFSPSPYKEDYKLAPSRPAFSNVGCSDQTQIPMIHSKHVTDRPISPDPCPGFVD